MRRGGDRNGLRTPGRSFQVAVGDVDEDAGGVY